MKGFIVMWAGDIADIPAGWHICDGTMGTPDLRNKFIVGAGSTYVPGDTGGQDSQTHTFTGDGHSHSLVAGIDIAPASGISINTDSKNVTGTTDAADNRPQYYALCYIQKL